MREKDNNLNGNQQKLTQSADIQKQLQRERTWTKLFAYTIQKIRHSLKTEDILKASVREVHRILKCDRALVYALSHESYGMVVAESVSSGWTKAERRIIKDPCFEARYLDKYRDGRFRAWNNIYEAGMSKCYIEQLERLEVKANLIVPIVSEGKLFGLLVIHQCSGTRQWQQSEILWLLKIATQVGFALDNANLLADAQRLSQQAEQERVWTEYFSDAVQQIRQSLKVKDVYKASVREVRRVLNCDRVLVYSLNQDNYGAIVAESVAHGWTRGEGRVIKDPCFEARYLDKYREGRVRAWSDIYQAGMSSCYIEQLEQLEVRANLVVPIVSQEKLFGLLVAHQCSGTRQWQQPEIDWLTQIAIQVAFALENAQMHEQIEQCTQDTQEILARAIASSSSIQRTIQNATVKFENLSNSCQNFAETIDKIKLLSKHIASKSISIAQAKNLSQSEQDNQNPDLDLSDKILALIQKLFESVAKIEPLFANIQTEITEKKSTLGSQSQQLIDEIQEFQAASQKLDRIVVLNYEMSNLLEKISNSLETQIQSSTFAKSSVRELTDITERISQQSLAIVKSLNK
ncbi:MAG: GAF domain-containing protein [Pleurocapsa sp. MO_226.B13]|nr:GAF domain-containing protein [Pleurocapsa sp. MO_226.B13]